MDTYPSYIKKNNIIDYDDLLFMPIDVTKNSGSLALQYHIYGVLMDGRTAVVMLDNIPIYFEIINPNSIPNFGIEIENLLKSFQLPGISVSYLELYEYKEFSTKPHESIRIHFNALDTYKKVLNSIKELNKYKIVSNTNTSFPDLDPAYYNKTAREFGFNTANWNVVEGKVIYNSSFNVDVVIYCDINNYKPASDEMLKKYRTLTNNPKIVTCYYDIETYSFDGIIPDDEEPENWTMTHLCATFGYYNTDKPLCRVVLATQNTEKHEAFDYLYICKDEEELLEHWINIMQMMKPYYMIAFNGFNFDTPCVIAKLRYYNLLERFVQAVTKKKYTSFGKNGLKYCFKEPKIKIDAQYMHKGKAMLNIPGIIEIDAMVAFKKKHSKANVTNKSSLNHYLKIHKLEGKVDMDYLLMYKVYEMMSKRKSISEVYPKMFKLFKDKIVQLIDYDENEPETTTLLKLSTQVSYYCMIDAFRIQQLFTKTNIIMEHMASANQSYIAMRDEIYRANNVKVINYVAKYCYERGVGLNLDHISFEEEDRNCFGGGLVPYPLLKLILDDPTAGLDFASLYPSLMIAFNLSPDKIITDEAKAKELMKLGYKLFELEPITHKKHDKDCKCHPEIYTTKAWTIKHHGAVEPNQKRIIGYKKCIKYKEGDSDKYIELELNNEEYGLDHLDNPIHFQRSHNVTEIRYKLIYGDNTLPNECMGINSIIMSDLLGVRAPLKKQITKFKDCYEDMIVKNLSDIIIDDIEYTIDEVKYKIAVYTAQSNAVKVLMNSFYGLSGSQNMPIYSLIIASGITTMGRHNITIANKFVTKLGYKVVYGDTDSIYVSINKDFLKQYDFDEELARANGNWLEKRIESWTNKVKETFKKIHLVNQEVNEYFMTLYGTDALKMSYEEVGFPAAYVGKKKYFFYQHIKQINFYPKEKDLFVRGITGVQQNRSGFTNILTMKYMMTILSPENTLSPLELVHNIIDEYFTTDWPLKEFIKFATYKPDKKNVMVHTYVDHMKEQYEIYKNEFEGTKCIGDYYEPPEPGEKFPYVIMEIDREFNELGSYVKTTTGDQAVSPGLFNYKGYKLDKIYYSKELLTTMARMLTVVSDFHPQGELSNEEFDAKLMKNVERHLVKYVKKYKKAPTEEFITKKKTLMGKTRKVTRIVDEHLSGTTSFANLVKETDLLNRAQKNTQTATKYVIRKVHAYVDLIAPNETLSSTSINIKEVKQKLSLCDEHKSNWNTYLNTIASELVNLVLQRHAIRVTLVNDEDISIDDISVKITNTLSELKVISEELIKIKRYRSSEEKQNYILLCSFHKKRNIKNELMDFTTKNSTHLDN